MCGSVLIGSGGGGGVGKVVAIRMGGNGGWRRMAVGGVAWQALGIRKEEEEMRMKRVKGTQWCGKNERKVLEAQCLRSEFEEAHGRYAGPFPSLAHDPTLHVLLEKWYFDNLC